MRYIAIGEARNRLSELVASIERSHERIVITRHGLPAVVLISAQDLAALDETVDILIATGTPGAIAEGLADLDADRIADNDALRARLPGQLPPDQ